MVQLEETTYEEILKTRQAQDEKILLLEAEVEWYRQQFGLAQKRLYGPSSEKSPIGQEEMLFNEAEACASATFPAAEKETITYSRRKKAKGEREDKFNGLSVEEIDYPQTDMTCPKCGGLLHKIGVDPHEEIKIYPPRVVLVRHNRDKCSCRDCERNGIKNPIVTAPMPALAFPNSFASPSAAAYIISQKYVEGLPLYRQQLSMKRLGFEISRQTLSNWVIEGANVLDLVFRRMKVLLLKRDIIASDDTPLQVLHEDGRKAETKSTMWLYRSGRDGPHIVLYDYQMTRSGEHPRAFLIGFAGYLQVDGYQAYDGLPERIILVGCWAHARRYFIEALDALSPMDRRRLDTAARTALAYCDKLFTIERDLADATAEERFTGRLLRSKPVLEQFQAWLVEMQPKVLDKTRTAAGIQYCLNQWSKLTAFLLDGRLEISNNRAERSIKPFVIGRKNWLFANTPSGANASALLYSIVETAKENGINPLSYLQFLFEQLPNIRQTDEALDKLMPWAEPIQQAHSITSKRPQ